MPKQTTYTNADLARFDHHAVPDQFGPWTTVKPPVGPPSSVEEQDYDPFAALARAKEFLAEEGKRELVPSHGPAPNDTRNHTLDTVNDIAASLFGDAGAGDSGLTRLRRSAATVAMPAALVGGPVGVAADTILGGEGAANFAEHPGVGSGLMALMGLIPGFKLLKGMGGAKNAAATTGEVLHGSDMFADAAGRVERVRPERVLNPFHPVTRPSVEVVPPSSAPGRTPYPGDVTGFNPADAHMPNSPGTHGGVMDAGADVGRFRPAESPVDRFMPNSPADVVHGPLLPSAPGIENLIERFMPNTPGDWTPASRLPEPSETRLDELTKLFGGRANTPVVPDSAKALIGRGDTSLFPALKGGRVGDLHTAQTTGGRFGFSDLPELSEAELSRLQDSMGRVMKKR